MRVALISLALVVFLGSCEAKAKAEPSIPSEQNTLSQNSSVDIRQLVSRAGLSAFTTDRYMENFDLPLLNGGNVSLSDYKGKYVLVNFWATWCPPCRMEMPSMQELYKTMQGQDFVMLAISVREDKATVSEFIKASGYSFPILLDQRGTLSGKYTSQGIPSTYLIDPEGKIIAGAVGAKDWNSSSVRLLLQTLLSQ